MILPDVPIDLWLKRHDLMVVRYDCPKCNQTFNTDVPVLVQDMAGVMSPIHKCGRRYKRLLLSPRTAASAAFWEQFAPDVSMEVSDD